MFGTDRCFSSLCPDTLQKTDSDGSRLCYQKGGGGVEEKGIEFAGLCFQHPCMLEWKTELCFINQDRLVTEAACLVLFISSPSAVQKGKFLIKNVPRTPALLK